MITTWNGDKLNIRRPLGLHSIIGIFRIEIEYQFIRIAMKKAVLVNCDDSFTAMAVYI